MGDKSNPANDGRRRRKGAITGSLSPLIRRTAGCCEPGATQLITTRIKTAMSKTQTMAFRPLAKLTISAPLQLKSWSAIKSRKISLINSMSQMRTTAARSSPYKSGMNRRRIRSGGVVMVAMVRTSGLWKSTRSNSSKNRSTTAIK